MVERGDTMGWHKVKDLPQAAIIAEHEDFKEHAKAFYSRLDKLKVAMEKVVPFLPPDAKVWVYSGPFGPVIELYTIDGSDHGWISEQDRVPTTTAVDIITDICGSAEKKMDGQYVVYHGEIPGGGKLKTATLPPGCKIEERTREVPAKTETYRVLVCEDGTEREL